MTLALDWLDHTTAADCDSHFARKAARDMGEPRQAPSGSNDLPTVVEAVPYGETLAASIARLGRADAIYFQRRAADNALLARYSLDLGELAHAARFQCAAAYFAGEARRSLFRLLENAQ